MEFQFKFRGLTLDVTAEYDPPDEACGYGGGWVIENVEVLGVQMSDFTDEEYQEMGEEAQAKAIRDEGF